MGKMLFSLQDECQIGKKNQNPKPKTKTTKTQQTKNQPQIPD